jgi:hypothetical protein
MHFDSNENSNTSNSTVGTKRSFCPNSSFQQLDGQKQALHVAISRPSVAVSLALSEAKGQGLIATRLELSKQFSRIK